MKEARTLFPPCGLTNFSSIVWRGIRSLSPGSVSSNPISTKLIGSTAGGNGVCGVCGAGGAWEVCGVCGKGNGVIREGPGVG